MIMNEWRAPFELFVPVYPYYLQCMPVLRRWATPGWSGSALNMSETVRA